MTEQWNAGQATRAPQAPPELTQTEIDQRVFELWHRAPGAPGRPASEYGTLCQVARAHRRGGRRQRALMLSTLRQPCAAALSRS